jgi:hypothetical protein
MLVLLPVSIFSELPIDCSELAELGLMHAEECKGTSFLLVRR